MNKYKFSMYSITIKSEKINGFLVANSKYNTLCYLSESEYEKTVNAHNYSENEIPEKSTHGSSLLYLQKICVQYKIYAGRALVRTKKMW